MKTMLRISFATVLALAALPAGCVHTQAVRTHGAEVDNAQRPLLLSSRDPQALLQLAMLHRQRRDLTRADQYWVLADRMLGENAAAEALRLGIAIAAEGGQYEAALARCRRHLSLKPMPEVRALLATLLETMEDWSGAEAERLRLYAEARGDAEREAQLAQFYARSPLAKHRRRAQELYMRYLARSPGGQYAAQARLSLGIAD